MTNITENFSYDRVMRMVFIALVMAAVGVAGWFGYRRYTHARDYAAYKDFVSHQESYKKTVAAGNLASGKWDELEKAFLVGAERHKNSALAPFFLAYAAEVVEKQNKPEAALALVQKALAGMPKHVVLYEYYVLKQALLKLDIPQEQVQKEGIAELTQLAQSTDAGIADMALYYRGLYAYTHGDTQAAQEIWTILTSRAKPDSYWRMLAQEKL